VGFKGVSFVILDSTLRLRLRAGLWHEELFLPSILFAAINGRSSTVRWTPKSNGKHFFFLPFARIAGKTPGVKPRRGFRPSYGHGQKRSQRPVQVRGMCGGWKTRFGKTDGAA